MRRCGGGPTSSPNRPSLPISRNIPKIAARGPSMWDGAIDPVETVKYSIVIPIYNEEQSFPALVKRLREVMDQLDGPTEVVLVDDGSRDSSYELMKAVNTEDPR